MIARRVTAAHEEADLIMVLRRHQADVAHVSCCQPSHGT